MLSLAQDYERRSAMRDARGARNDAPPPLLAVDRVSLEYRTARHVVRAAHRVSFEIDDGDRQN